LEDYKDGSVSAEDIISQLSILPYQDLGFAKVDHHRAIRKGFPEVIYGSGKTPKQIYDIAASLLQASDKLLVTRASREIFKYIKNKIADAKFDSDSKTIVVNRADHEKKIKGVVVASAGTADISVASEAAITAELMGCEVKKEFDVGVAGLHRLIDRLPSLRKATVVIAVAGMDGVLPSVLGGLLQAPIIAVPTSIGYGAGREGLSPLLTMLNSCSPGVAVVNIDNGFGAGYIAAIIARQGN